MKKIGVVWALSGVAITTAFAFACTPAASSSGGSTTSSGSGDDFTVVFSPVYSAYDGVHTFAVPMTVSGVKKVSWSTDHPELVDISKVASDGVTVTLTMKGSGTATVTASAGGLSGSATLTITPFTSDQWATGSTRYISGASTSIMSQLMQEQQDGDGGADGGDTSKFVACTSCHGSGQGQIEHTPEQTGGYSDDEMKNIFLNGTLPSTVDDRFGQSPQWHAFHQWQATSDEATGLVAYLRSLTPASQKGFDFGEGHGSATMNEGTMPPLGAMAGPPPDGFGGPPDDTGATPDAGTTSNAAGSK